MLSYIAIRGLYDMYDYEVSFSKEEKLKIITGPNGYGKTTILRIIKNLIDCKFWWFYFLMFREIIVSFSDGTYIEIARESSQKLKNGESDLLGSDKNIKVTFNYSIPEKETEPFVLGKNTIIRLIRIASRRYYRVSEELEENIDYEEVLSNYRFDDIEEALRDISSELYNYLKSQKCVLISEQRAKYSHIHRRGPETFEQISYAIETIKKELSDIILQTQAKFAKESQDVDASFVKQLFAVKKGYSEDEYNKKADILKVLIENIQSYGLAKDLNINYTYKEKYNEALKVYIDGMIKKMNVYFTLFRQLSLFDSLVNHKGLSNKKMVLGGKEILTIKDKTGKIVPLRKLSSGEQNLIILYYDLIFKANEGDILLIDEPENSMHNAWLIDMLDDYENMADLNDIQIIFSTHSAVFINGNYDITYDLYKDGKSAT